LVRGNRRIRAAAKPPEPPRSSAEAQQLLSHNARLADKHGDAEIKAAGERLAKGCGG